MSIVVKGILVVDRVMETWKEYVKVDGESIVRMEKWEQKGEILAVLNY